MAFTDLLWVAGQDNLAGLVGEAYICPTDDILTVPALAAAGGLVSAAIETILKLKFPGDDSAVAQFVRDWQNTPCVIIFKDAKTGLFKLLGVCNLDKATTVLSITIPAYLETADMNSGGKRADSRGTEISWKFTCAHPPVTYMSTVPLTPAP